ncbi:hypothetical protein BDR26DRAFT_922885, partial [Obelidium mucronatum]
MSTIDLNHSLSTRISPEDPCWANWFAQEAAPPFCEAGRCADHFKVRVNFEDVTKTVNQPLERKTLTAAQMWCALLNCDPAAVTSQGVVCGVVVFDLFYVYFVL